jgi:hypothetical protein
MRSKERVESLDNIEIDVPTTAEDIAALERARASNTMDPYQFMRFHLLFAPQHPNTREIPPFHEPFTL